MIICRDELREFLEEQRRDRPFPETEPFDDLPILEHGWLYGSTLGYQPIEEVASEMNRLFGRDDFEELFEKWDSVSDIEGLGDVMRFMSMHLLGPTMTLSFFVHPCKRHLLPGYTSIMSFETIKNDVAPC